MEFEAAMERVSLLYAVSYASLLFVGALCLALANPALGATLFFLGLVLLAGDEYAKSRKQAQGRFRSGVSSEISGMVAFSLAACAASLCAALVLSSFYGWDGRMLLLAFSGLAASAVKVMAATIWMLLAK